jgi:hypothetical protein
MRLTRHKAKTTERACHQSKAPLAAASGAF